jgi:hypothetical protein
MLLSAYMRGSVLQLNEGKTMKQQQMSKDGV